MQSWLTWASRLANSQASASNAGVQGDPNSPESNCLYLAQIWSVKELYSLCASCTVNKQVAFQLNANHLLAESMDYIKFEGM